MVVCCRFRVLAGHFQTMYPNLNIDVDAELHQLKVSSSECIVWYVAQHRVYETTSQYGFDLWFRPFESCICCLVL